MKKSVALIVSLVLGLVLAQDQKAVTISEFVKISEGFSTLATALETTELDELLQDEGTFTFFAPTDEAFAAMPAGRRDALLNNPQALRALLRRHILTDRILAGELASRGRARSAEGSDLSFSSRGDGAVVVDNTATVVGANVGVYSGLQVGNGVIHVIDAVLPR